MTNIGITAGPLLGIIAYCGAIMCAGCDTSEESNTKSSVDQTEEDSIQMERSYALLAEFSLDDGTMLEFGQTDSGGIVVAELGPATKQSPVTALMGSADATPLELFLAVAPPGAVAPEALWETHYEFMEEAGLETEPRDLAHLADSQFRVETETDKWIGRGCNKDNDEFWFKAWWLLGGWETHDYHRSENYVSSTPTVSDTNSLRAHLCNNSETTHKIFRVEKTGSDQFCLGTPYISVFLDVPPEHRALFTLWKDDFRCAYKGEGTTVVGGNDGGEFGLGIMGHNPSS